MRTLDYTCDHFTDNFLVSLLLLQQYTVYRMYEPGMYMLF